MPTVLIVDDEISILEVLEDVLLDAGFVVVTAMNGREGLERLGETMPDLVLLDLMMPVMDGFAFLHALRERPGCAHIPVVVLTARDLSAEDRERLDGADRVLSKGETSLRDIANQLRTLAEGGEPPEPAIVEKP